MNYMDDRMIEEIKGIGKILAQESDEDREIQKQLSRLILWEFTFTGVLSRRDTVERTHGIRFEIRPKEDERHVPHCHAHYQGQNVSISLVDYSVLAGSIPKDKQRFAVMWVQHNLDVLQKHWDKYHVLEV